MTLFHCEKCGTFDDPDQIVFKEMGGRLFGQWHSCGARLVYPIKLGSGYVDYEDHPLHEPTEVKDNILPFPKEKWNG